MYHLSEIYRVYNLPNEHAQESFCRGVERWSSYLYDLLEHSDPRLFLERLPFLLTEAWQHTGIRSQLLQLLARDSVIGTDEQNLNHVRMIGNILTGLGYVFAGYGSIEDRVRTMRGIYSIFGDAHDHMSIVWTKEQEAQDPDDRYAWQDHAANQKTPLAIYYPIDHLNVVTTKKNKVERINLEDLVAKSLLAKQEFRDALLSGQQAAYDALGHMYRAREAKLSAGGITPRLHGLIIGPSGSGKTHVVRVFAKAEGLELYEQSAASWMPNGSKAQVSTPQKIAQFVENNLEGIIYIDEVEKPFPKNLLMSSAWERANADELMSLLDAKVTFWEGWSEELARKLDQSFFIILSGAWQSAYQQAYRIHSLLGGDWSNLSIADSFLDENHLPQELLNRVSTNVIEVLSPSKEEIAAMVMKVQGELGVEVDDSEARRVAKEIVFDRKGVRGVESYILQKWIAVSTGSQVSGANQLRIQDLS